MKKSFLPLILLISISIFLTFQNCSKVNFNKSNTDSQVIPQGSPEPSPNLSPSPSPNSTPTPTPPQCPPGQAWIDVNADRLRLLSVSSLLNSTPQFHQ